MIRGLYKAISTPSSNGLINKFTNQQIVNSISRSFSTATTSKNESDKPKLKHILKRFYLMIHPDTLSSHPQEKNVNSHNMKLFMSIFDQYKKRPTPDPNTKPTVHNLQFFIPDRSSGTKQFKLIDIEMIQNALNPQHIPNQIRLLFEKCSLPTDFITEIEMVDNVKLPSINGSLREFLLDNKQFVNQLLNISAKQKSELDSIVRKIKRESKLNIQMTTNPLDSNFSYQENYHALLHFQEVVGKWKSEVEEAKQDGYELVVNQILKFDLNHTDVNFTSSEPICYLDRSSPENWYEYLSHLNLSNIKNEVEEEKKENAIKAAQFTKERLEFYTHTPVLEKLLKVRSLTYQEHDDPTEDPKLYLNPQEQMTQTLDFTKMLMSNKSKIENLMKTKFKKYKFSVNVLIVPNLQKTKFWVDIDGSLKINPLVTFDEFCDILESQHKNAMNQSRLADKMEAVRDYAQVRMGLRHLTCLSSFVYNHGHSKVFEAYQKLHDSADRLRDIGLSGFTIIIGDYYSVSKTGEIVLKYDFNTQELIKQLTSPRDEQQEQQQPAVKQVEEDINIDLTNISNVLEQYENQSNKRL